MTNLSSNHNAPAHVLVIPFPAQGHMIPLLHLTRKLASYGCLTFTIFTTPKNLAYLNPLITSHPSIDTLVLPFPSHPRIPHGIENVKDMPQSLWNIMLAMANLHGPLVQWFKSHASPPQFIISDMFCAWTQRLASELGIKRIVFSPSGALALSTMYFLWREEPKRENDKDEHEVISYYNLPNSPKYPWWQVSLLYRSYVKGEPDSEHFKDAFHANMASWGLIVNSFAELEKPYLDHLRRDLGHDRVWAVGPLLPPGDDLNGVAQLKGSCLVLGNDVMSWLDKQENRKVVYICFGSQTFLTNDQAVGIASALEKSGVPFVWSMKQPREHDQDDHGVIPKGFEDRTAGRGLVIRDWAPQVLILRHRAVGAFLTHCGWNSVLEAVVAGVPLLAWPMSADQFANATLLVEELKVAKQVCEGAKRTPDWAELARVLAESVGRSGSEETIRAMKFKKAAVEAIKENNGSSVKQVGYLMQQLEAMGVNKV